MAINRNDLDDDFDERDRLLLNTLRPHLAQSYEQIRERDRLHGSVGALAARSRTGTHVIVLDPARTRSPGALVLLYRYFGRPGARDPFPARLHPVARRPAAERPGRRRRRAAAARADRGERGGARLVVRYLPATPTVARGPPARRACRAGPRRRAGRLGLTAARSRGAPAPRLRGATRPRRWRRSCTCRPRRVKTHLEHIYRKLGARSRTQAVAMALTLLPGGGATDDARNRPIGRLSPAPASRRMP